jgi:thiamine biosynthesis lipoprotein
MDTVFRHCSALLLLLVLAGCVEPSGESAEFFVFGTLVDIQLPDASPRQAEGIFSELQQEFQRMHGEWHAWEPGELHSLNARLATGEAARTTPDIIELIRRSREMELRSDGRFNAAAGQLVEAWGFHTSDYPIIGPPPSEAEISELVALAPSSMDVITDGNVVSTSNRHVQFDFGGIAKGYATDLAIEVIRQRGQTNAVINAGGDVRVLGEHHGRPWRIGIRDPAGGVAGALEIDGDKAVFTSGNYERYHQFDGARYAHILDPRSGWPVHEVSSATVVAENGTTADAAATALVVAGVDDWAEVAERMGVEAALVIDEAGNMYATPSMMAYISVAPGRETSIIGPQAQPD